MISIKPFVCICLIIGQNVFADTYENYAKFNQNNIEKILASLKQNPYGLLSSNFSELKQINQASIEILNQCYNSTLGGETVDIFRETIGDLVRKYFDKFPLNVDLSEMNKRTEMLISNIFKIAGWVLECVLNTDPNYEPLKLGLTQMSIYTSDEFQDSQMASDFSVKRESKCEISDVSEDVLKGIKTFDWRERTGNFSIGIVLPVRNIGSACQSGYVFAAVAAMETAYTIQKFPIPVRFSEQALIDCGYVTGTLSHSCQHSLFTSVWDAAKAIAIVAEGDYHPYTGQVGECIRNKIITRPTGYCLNRDKINFQAVVYKYGPAVIGIAANSEKFFHLKGPWTGSAKECGTRPTTAMTIVGWDEKYWFIRNQWGTEWGVDGYLYLPRNITNICGIHAGPIGVPFF